LVFKGSYEVTEALIIHEFAEYQGVAETTSTFEELVFHWHKGAVGSALSL
jgi:hypothetical protein